MLTAPAVPGSTCAVSALRAICHNRVPDEPLFILDGQHPLSKARLNAAMVRSLEESGVPKKGYSGHSFHRGAASAAAASGADNETLRRLGRWAPSSTLYLRYIDRTAATRAADARATLYSSAAQTDLTNAWRDF